MQKVNLNNKKLCFVTFQFKTGGVERIFTAIANNLDCEIALLTVTNKYDSMVENIPSSVEIIPIHKNWWLRFLWHINTYIPILPFLLILLSEIIYLRLNKKWKHYTFVNFSDTISSLAVSCFGGGKKKRYSWLHYNPKTINQSRFAAFYKIIYRKMDKIVCICHEQKKIMQEVIPGLKEENLTVIYNIMDYDKILALKDVPIDYKKKYILMIARFDFRSKDFYTLVDAYHNLDESLKNSHQLLLIGDGPDLDTVQDYVKMHNELDNIIFVGKEDNPYKWISKAETLVLSSRTEGLPTVLLEALICGTPAISTLCETGVKEILNNGKCGMLVPIGDADSMSRALTRMLTDNELRYNFITKGYIQAQQFHPNQILPKIKQLFEI
ncbi:MAG: glycosyltransferase [Bacteroides sp.]|nr:glycosyltransferase [Bacteroides sp.]